MFIDKIIVQGFLEVQGTEELIFSYQNNSHEDDELDVNKIKSGTFVTAFSVIFDSKYNENYNFSDIINRLQPSASFIEIRLWQSESDLESKYKWLMNKELKLKRFLKHPNQKYILINDKSFYIRDFHEAIANLGFINVNNLHIHRLLEEEMIKLGHYIGDDLWNLIMKIISCEELIEITERKQGVVKRKFLKRNFKMANDSINFAMLKTIKLRNDIRDQFKIDKKFMTLVYLMNERNISILQNQNKCFEHAINEKSSNLKEAINFKNEKIQHEVDIAGRKICHFENMNELIELRRKLNMKHTSVKVAETRSTFSEYVPEFFSSEKKSLLHENANDDGQMGNFWKIVLKKMLDFDKDKVYNFLTEAIKISELSNDKLFQLKESLDRHKSELEGCESTEETNKKKLTLHRSEEELIAYEFNRDKIIMESKSKLHELKIEMLHLCNKIKMDSNYFYILEMIETSDDQKIQENYLGPVYRYLDARKLSNKTFWKEISMPATTILFRKACTIEKVISNLKYPCECNFLGIDEYTPDENTLENLEEDQIFSAKVLIENTASKQLKKVLHGLLSEFFVCDESDSVDCTNYYYEKNVTVSEKFLTSTHSKGSRTIFNETGNSSTENPISVLLEIDKKLRERKALHKNIHDEEVRKEKALNKFRENVQQIKKEEAKNIACTSYAQISSFYLNEERARVENILRSKCLEAENIRKIMAENGENWDTENLKNNLQFEIFLDTNQNEWNILCSMFTEFLSITQDILLHSFKEEKLANESEEMTMNNIEEQFEVFIRAYDNDIKGAIEKIYNYKIDAITFENFENFYQTKIIFSEEYAKIVSNIHAVNVLQKIIFGADEDAEILFDQQLYDLMQENNPNDVLKEITALHHQRIVQKSQNLINISLIGKHTYTRLVDSINYFSNYSNEKVFAPLKLKERVYPLMNIFVVKLLKDTVNHFKVTYNALLSHYIRPSTLFFYTSGSNEEFEDDKFSWNCFEMTRLKAIDFAEKWHTESKSEIGMEAVKRIKGFLLILYIINYISIFKFIIISDKLFEDMNDVLVQKIMKFLKTIMPFVQIIIYEDEKETNRPMEIDEISSFDL